MKLNEFTSQKEQEQLAEFLPALGAIAGGVARVGAAGAQALGRGALAVGRGIGQAATAVGRGVARAAPKVAQAVGRGVQATARGVGNTMGQMAGSTMSGFQKTAPAPGAANNQQAQQQAALQQTAIAQQQDIAAQIAELEKQLQGIKQQSGLR